MKRAIVFSIALLAFAPFLVGQPNLYDKVITFENNSQLVSIDTSQQNNIWQIGTPQKAIFDSAFSAPFAIVTDTLNNYPINNTSSFQVKIIPPVNSCWGNGWIVFSHKFSTQKGKAGGFLEVKYDNDSIWTNIIFDEEPWGVWTNEFYSEEDTITGNIPAFTGSSDEWYYSEVYWEWFIGVGPREFPFYDSLTIRFTFKSDSDAVPDEGWLIDDIVLALYECTGSVQENKGDYIKSSVSPNPVVDNSTISLNEEIVKPVTLRVFTLQGQLISEEVQRISDLVIRRSDYNSGIYFYQIEDSERLISQGKFIVSPGR